MWIKREWSCRMRSSIPFKIQITDSNHIAGFDQVCLAEYL